MKVGNNIFPTLENQLLRGYSDVIHVIKNKQTKKTLANDLPANAGDIRDKGLIPGLGRSHKYLQIRQNSC